MVFIKTAASIRGQLVFEGVFFNVGVNICAGYNRGWLVFDGGLFMLE